MWKAVLKGAFAIPMTPEELALFRAVAQRDPPKRRVRELWAVVGQRQHAFHRLWRRLLRLCLHRLSQDLKAEDRLTVVLPRGGQGAGLHRAEVRASYSPRSGS